MDIFGVLQQMWVKQGHFRGAPENGGETGTFSGYVQQMWVKQGHFRGAPKNGGETGTFSGYL